MAKVGTSGRGGASPGERRGGRQKGTPNRASIATWERIENEADPIGFLANVMIGEPITAAPSKYGDTSQQIIPTLDQRLTAASQLSRWMPPPPRVRPIAMDLPPLTTAEDMTTTMAAVVDAMACGEITPDEAKAVAEVIEIHRRTIETGEHERRLAAIELEQANKDKRR